MSGGSFDYLCDCQDLRDLMEKRHQLQEMRDALSRLGYADDAASETAELVLVLRQANVRVEAAIKRLSPVWKAVEWLQSADYSEDQVQKALVEYRGDAKDCFEAMGVSA